MIDPRSLRRVETALERFEPVIRDAFLLAVQTHRDRAPIAQVIAALEAGNLEQAVNLTLLPEPLLASFGESVRSAYAGGAQTIIAGAPRFAGAVGFDGRAARAEYWARSHVGGLVTEIVADQRTMLRGVITAGVQQGRAPRSMAQDLIGRLDQATGRRVGGFIGLTSGQQRWVESARAELVDLDSSYFSRSRRDRRFDPMVRRAIESGNPLTRDQVDRIVGRYSDRVLQYRAEVIARTESINALRAGRAEGIAQAIEQGAVDKDRVDKVWSATLDKSTRPDHVAMHGQRKKSHEAFVFPDGSQAMYPGDSSLGAPGEQTVQCRCYQEYDVDWLSGPMGTKPATEEVQATASSGVHFTTPEAASSILENGFDFDASGSRTWQGSGLYMFEGEIPTTSNYGPHRLEVVHRASRTFEGTVAEIERMVAELKLSLVPPIFRLPDGSTIPDQNGEPIRAWNPDNTQNSALRKAWIERGFDSIRDAETGVFVLLDPSVVISLLLDGVAVRAVESQS